MAVLTPLALLAWGCGANTVPPGSIEVTDDSPPEVHLASIDGGGAIVEEDQVTRYAFLLDKLGTRCTEGRRELADFAAGNVSRLEDEAGVETTTLSQLEQVEDASQTGPRRTRCAAYFAVAYELGAE